MTEFTKEHTSLKPTGSSGTGPSSLQQQPMSSVVKSEALNVPDVGPLPSHQQPTSSAQIDGDRHDIKENTVGSAAFSPDVLKDQRAHVIDSAKDLASKAREKVEEQVASHKNTASDYIGKIASAMQRAAKEVEKDVPFAATYVKKAADSVRDISDSVRAGNFSDLAQEAQAFIRRRPYVVVGLTVLAGFGVVRFLKSAAPTYTKTGGRFPGSPSDSSAANQGYLGRPDHSSASAARTDDGSNARTRHEPVV